jgi:hypothetical protein
MTGGSRGAVSLQPWLCCLPLHTPTAQARRVQMGAVQQPPEQPG